jgi:hypothetical protein
MLPSAAPPDVAGGLIDLGLRVVADPQAGADSPQTWVGTAPPPDVATLIAPVGGAVTALKRPAKPKAAIARRGRAAATDTAAVKAPASTPAQAGMPPAEAKTSAETSTSAPPAILEGAHPTTTPLAPTSPASPGSDGVQQAVVVEPGMARAFGPRRPGAEPNFSLRRRSIRGVEDGTDESVKLSPDANSGGESDVDATEAKTSAPTSA